MIELGKETERVILVGVSLTEQEDTRKSLDELKDLASTAGAETVGTVIQSRDQVHPGTYVGKGKIDEIKDLLWELNATGIICDDELIYQCRGQRLCRSSKSHKTSIWGHSFIFNIIRFFKTAGNNNICNRYPIYGIRNDIEKL